MSCSTLCSVLAVRARQAAHAVCVLVFLLIALPAAAMDRLDLAMPLSSYHFDRSVNRNENNPGLGIEARFERFTLAIGSYVNSSSTRSRYLNVHLPMVQAGPFSSAVVVGTVDGYAFSNGGFGPMAALALKWIERDAGMTLFLLPPVSGITGGALAVQFQQRLR